MEFWPLAVWLFNAIVVLVLAGVVGALVFLIVGTLGGAIINLRDRRRRERQQRQIEEYTRALADRGVEKRP